MKTTVFPFLVLCSINYAHAAQLPGWPIDLPGGWHISQPVTVDLDGNGKDELIIGSNEKVYIFNEQGNNLPNWPQSAGAYPSAVGSVAAGDIDGDGDYEIVAMGAPSWGTGIYAWHFETGSLVSSWPINVIGDFVLADFDNNPSDLEIAVASVREYVSPSLKITIYDGNAAVLPGWPQTFDIPNLSQVYLSAGNIDKSGNDELVVACHRSSYYQSPLYVLNSTGQVAPGWPVYGNGPFVSPAILCSLDQADDFEIVAPAVNSGHTGRIYALKPDATLVEGWPAPYNAFNISAGDLNSDNRPEIIASYSNTTYWADHLAVINCNGSQLLSKTLELRDAATVGNADNDTASEIIMPSWDGNLHVMNLDGQDLPGFPLYLTNGIYGMQSALADLDGDGNSEVIQVDRDEKLLHAISLQTPVSENPDWPMYRRDPRRSSCWTPPLTSGWDILEITGPSIVVEKSSTPYIAKAYFRNGSQKDVTLQASWHIDPCCAQYAHFQAGGILLAHELSTYKDITVYAAYTEGAYAQSASFKVRLRPTVQLLYVDDDAKNDPGPGDPLISDTNEHGTADHPFDTVQEAIDAAGDGDKVIAMPGRYKENLDCKGRNFTLTSIDPCDPSVVRSTMIDPASSSAIIASNGTITGLSILGSTGIVIGQYVPPYKSYSPLITNCIIDVTGCGIEITVPSFQDVIHPTIQNNLIKAQTGIYLFSNASLMEPVIRNNTIIGKNPSLWGAGIQYRVDNEVPFVSNNIIWNFMYGISITYDILKAQRAQRITYNNICSYNFAEGSYSGGRYFDLTGIQGNIRSNPLFLAPLSGDYRLSQDSPCINIGDPAFVPPLGTKDLGGLTRVMGGRIDMGAYEFAFPGVPLADAGPDQRVYAWIDGNAKVALDGSRSTDPDNDALAYKWTWKIGSASYSAAGANPVIVLPAGIHTVTLVVNDGLSDSLPDDVNITVVEAIHSSLKITPSAINAKSSQPSIKAMLDLPVGIYFDDVDAAQPLCLSAGLVQSTRQWFSPIHLDSSQPARIFAFFDKAMLIKSVAGSGNIELKVVGKLKSGQYFYGADTVKIIK